MHTRGLLGLYTHGVQGQHAPERAGLLGLYTHLREQGYEKGYSTSSNLAETREFPYIFGQFLQNI